ncbi:MAG: 7-cyano-7-deazaguanine synthase [Euryarchaeota archaeon]|nr:7-cyano-7-deazaguanine synthase [Euryarchaeota archaeon]
MKQALALLSGGLDSAVALGWAIHRGFRVHPITFHYHRRPRREVEATRALARWAGGERLREVDLPFLREVEDVPPRELRNPALRRSPPGYIPGRNLLFYSIALHYASLLGARTIVGAHHRGDRQTFPDAHPGFFQGLNRLAQRHELGHIRVETPLIHLTKTQIIRRGRSLGVPLGLTWSCYEDRPAPCNRCPSCRERAEAFHRLGWEDPTPRTRTIKRK